MAKGKPKGRKTGTLKAKLNSESENYQPPDVKGPRQSGRPRSTHSKEKSALTPETSDKVKGPRQSGRPRSTHSKEKSALTPETSDKKKPVKKRGRPCSLQKHSSVQEITEEEKAPWQRGRPRSSKAKELTPETSDKKEPAKKRQRRSLQKHSSAREITEEEEKAPRQRGRPRSSKAKEAKELTPETSDKKEPAKKRQRRSLQKHSSAQEITEEEDIIPKKRRSSRTLCKNKKPNEVQYVDCHFISNEENEQKNHDAYCPSENYIEESTRLLSENYDTEKDSIFSPKYELKEEVVEIIDCPSSVEIEGTNINPLLDWPQENHETYCPSENYIEELKRLFSENYDTEKDSIFHSLTTKLIPVVEKPALLTSEIVEECVPASKYELKEEVVEIIDCPSSVEIEGTNINPPLDWPQDAAKKRTEEPISSQQAFCNSSGELEISEFYEDLERFQPITNEPTEVVEIIDCPSSVETEGTNINPPHDWPQDAAKKRTEEPISSQQAFCNSSEELEFSEFYQDLERFQPITNGPMVVPQEVSNIKTTNGINKPKPRPKSYIYSSTNGFSEVNVTFTQVCPTLSTLNIITFENILRVIKERYQNDLHSTGVLEDSVFRSMYTDVFQSSDSDEQKHKDLKKLVYGMALYARIHNKDPTISSLESFFSMEKIYVILESIKEMCESFEKADCNLSLLEGLLWFFNTAGAKLIRESLSKCCGEEEKSAKIRNINIVLEVVNSNWKNLMKGNTQVSLHSTTVPVEVSDYITCDFITPHS